MDLNGTSLLSDPDRALLEYTAALKEIQRDQPIQVENVRPDDICSSVLLMISEALVAHKRAKSKGVVDDSDTLFSKALKDCGSDVAALPVFRQGMLHTREVTTADHSAHASTAAQGIYESVLEYCDNHQLNLDIDDLSPICKMIGEYLGNAEAHGVKNPASGSWAVGGFITTTALDNDAAEHHVNIAIVGLGSTIADTISQARGTNSELNERIALYEAGGGRHLNSDGERAMVVSLQDYCSSRSANDNGLTGDNGPEELRGFGIGTMSALEDLGRFSSGESLKDDWAVAIQSGNECVRIPFALLDTLCESGVRNCWLNADVCCETAPDDGTIKTTEVRFAGTVIVIRFKLDVAAIRAATEAKRNRDADMVNKYKRLPVNSGVAQTDHSSLKV